MTRIRTALAVASFFIATSSYAQMEERVRIGQTDVAVTTNEGYVNFFSPSETRLSFVNTSFFTIRIGDKIYTNNGQQHVGTFPIGKPDAIETNNNTIVATWQIDNVKIEQVVESRANTQTNIIPAVRYYVTNLATTDIEVQPQYLLDISIRKSDGREYKLLGGSGSSLSQEWSAHTTIPDYVIFYEREWAPPTYDQGQQADLSFDDAMFARPSVLVFGDWKHMEDQPFLSSDAPFPTSFILDLAVGMQWNAQVIAPGARKEIAIFSFGSSIHMPSSVDERESAALSVYPNPVSSELNVGLSNEVNTQARIQNVLGQTVWSGVLSGASTIDVRQLEAGSYFLIADGRVTSFVVSR